MSRLTVTMEIDVERSARFQGGLDDPRAVLQAMTGEGHLQLHSLNYWLALKSVKILEADEANG